MQVTIPERVLEEWKSKLHSGNVEEVLHSLETYIPRNDILHKKGDWVFVCNLKMVAKVKSDVITGEDFIKVDNEAITNVKVNELIPASGEYIEYEIKRRKAFNEKYHKEFSNDQLV